MKLAITMIAVLFAAPCFAVQKYNPFSGQFETTTPDAQITYNPYDGSHTYVPRPYGNEPIQEYNPYTGTFEIIPDTSAPDSDSDSDYSDD